MAMSQSNAEDSSYLVFDRFHKTVYYLVVRCQIGAVHARHRDEREGDRGVQQGVPFLLVLPEVDSIGRIDATEVPVQWVLMVGWCDAVLYGVGSELIEGTEEVGPTEQRLLLCPGPSYHAAPGVATAGHV